MTEPPRPLTEEELHAYVDEQLSPERRTAVDCYLEAHSEAAERIAAYKAQRDGLRAVFAARLAEPVPPSLNLARLVEERMRRQRHASWRIAAAVLLGLGLGVGGGGTAGWWLATRDPPPIDALVQDAAASYAAYVPDAHRPVELWAADRDEMTRWVSSRLNHKVAPPDLSFAGYRLLGGRLVATGHGAAALFVFENAPGMRLAVFVRPTSGNETTPIASVDLDNVDGCAWLDRGLGYSLIGGESYDRLVDLSRHIRQQARMTG